MTLKVMRRTLHLDIGLVGRPTVINDLFGLPNTNLGVGRRMDEQGWDLDLGHRVSQLGVT